MKKHLNILILLVLICTGLTITGCKSNSSGSGKLNINIGDDSNSSSNKVTATKIVVTSAAKNVMADAVSSAVSVEAQDASGNVATGFNSTVSLTSSSTTMKFGSSVVYTDTLGTLMDNVTSITLSAGEGSFYFKDTKAGSPIITVSLAGLASSTQTETFVCTAHTHCQSAEICQATICKTALNRVYRVTVKDA